MPIEIEVNGEIIEFPDGMPDSEIESVLQREFGSQPQAAPAQSFLDKMPHTRGMLGAAEGLANIASGGLSSIPAGIAGLVAGIAPGGKSASEMFESVAGAGTYQPRLQEGANIASALQKPIGAVEGFVDRSIERGVDDSASPTSLFDLPGYALQKLAGPENIKTAAKTTVLGAPALLGLRGKASQSPRQQVAAKAQRHGYVVDPGSTTSGAGSLVEGLGGKIKTQQIASQRNQAVTNRLAKQELGLADDAILSPELLSAERAQAALAYEPIRNAGKITADTAYRRDLSNALQKFKNPAKDFPKLTKGSIEKLVNIADDLNKQAFDASSAVDAMQLLRQRADKAFLSQKGVEGRAWRQLSDALEGAVERNLVRQLGPANKIVSDFRAARAQIAKSHSVEKALQGSDVSATKLAAQKRGGAPLSGHLKDIADFAAEFPKVTRVLKEAVPNFSPLDMANMTLSVPLTVAGNTLAPGIGTIAGMAPFIGSALRPHLRSMALGPLGQRAAINPGTVPGSSVGLLGAGALAEEAN